MFNIKIINRLIISTLILINILILSRFQMIFNVASSITSTLFMPIVVAIVLYYLIKPAFEYLIKIGLDKLSSIIVIYLVILLSTIFVGYVTIPTMINQLEDFIKSLPEIVMTLNDKFHDGLKSLSFLSDDNIEMINTFLKTQIVNSSKSISLNSLKIVNSLTTSITKLSFSIFIAPFIVFYVINDELSIYHHLQKIIPDKHHQKMKSILEQTDDILSSYVQGQLTISFFVFIIFLIVFNIINLPYATLFSVIGGLFNVIPYFGSLFVTAIVLIFSITISPFMFVKTAIACVVEQTVEGRIVTPLVMSKQLDIHPLTIIVVLLISNSIFGVVGVFISIPIYSICKLILQNVNFSRLLTK